MEIKLMFGEYEITISEQGEELTISAQKDGEVEEEFTLSKEGEPQSKADSSQMKGFDEFEDDEKEDDWDEDDKDWDSDEDEIDEDDEDDDDDDDDEGDDDDDDKEEEEEEEDLPTRSTGSKMIQGPKMGEPKLESFSSFLTKNKRR